MKLNRPKHLLFFGKLELSKLFRFAKCHNNERMTTSEVYFSKVSKSEVCIQNDKNIFLSNQLKTSWLWKLTNKMEAYLWMSFKVTSQTNCFWHSRKLKRHQTTTWGRKLWSCTSLVHPWEQFLEDATFICSKKVSLSLCPGRTKVKAGVGKRAPII